MIKLSTILSGSRSLERTVTYQAETRTVGHIPICLRTTYLADLDLLPACRLGLPRVPRIELLLVFHSGPLHAYLRDHRRDSQHACPNNATI